MKFGKFNSLAELKEENDIRKKCSNISKKEEINKLPIKQELPTADNTNCPKHGVMHRRAVRIGAQITKIKRVQNNGDFAGSSIAFSDSEIARLIVLHEQAEREFRFTRCTCYKSKD